MSGCEACLKRCSLLLTSTFVRSQTICINDNQSITCHTLVHSTVYRLPERQEVTKPTEQPRYCVYYWLERSNVISAPSTLHGAIGMGPGPTLTVPVLKAQPVVQDCSARTATTGLYRLRVLSFEALRSASSPNVSSSAEWGADQKAARDLLFSMEEGKQLQASVLRGGPEGMSPPAEKHRTGRHCDETTCDRVGILTASQSDSICNRRSLTLDRAPACSGAEVRPPVTQGACIGPDTRPKMPKIGTDSAPSHALLSPAP